MKKLWSKYSYAMILVGLSIAGAFILSIVFPASMDEYVKITVSEGDTLWNISEEYAEYHHLSKREFVIWVEQYNEITASRIFIGDELIIPVKDSAVEINDISNLASN